MDPIDEEYIKDSRDLGAVVLDINGQSCSVNLTEVGLRAGDFPFAIIADSPNIPETLLGYAGFYDNHPSTLATHDSSLLELKMLKVDPQYFQNGIGTAILEYSLQMAEERGKTLVLEPEQPGELYMPERRLQEYPLNTEQLKDFYLRHGFRTLTAGEIDNYVKLRDDDFFTQRLWFGGINPQTSEMTGQSRHTMTREEKASLDHIPFEEKLELYRQNLIDEYGTDSALRSNHQFHRKSVQDYLIAV